MNKAFAIIAAALLLVSCGGGSKQLLPSVSGKAGEILVVMDKSYWESNPGNAVRELLASDCPWLAQKEPLYSLVNIVPSNFVKMFQVHRNILMVRIEPQVQTEGMVYRNDVWAQPQCVIQLSAASEDRAMELIAENGQAIAGTFEQAERDRVIANSKRYEERSIASAVNDIFGGSPHFPSGYKLKKATSDFVWVADEKQFVQQGVFIYRYPARRTGSEMSLESIIARRNETLRLQVPGMFENTWMTTAEFLPPTLEYIRFRGREFAQVRGFWEVKNDFMGGPFVSQSFYSPDGEYVVVLEAFVYAPKYDKRQYLRQVESILYSFEWLDAKDEK